MIFCYCRIKSLGEFSHIQLIMHESPQSHRLYSQRTTLTYDRALSLIFSSLWKMAGLPFEGLIHRRIELLFFLLLFTLDDLPLTLQLMHFKHWCSALAQLTSNLKNQRETGFTEILIHKMPKNNRDNNLLSRPQKRMYFFSLLSNNSVQCSIIFIYKDI